VFAHSAAELQPLPDLSRTKLCKILLSTGKCQDPHCTYAHNKEELRSGRAVDRSLLGKGQQKTPRRDTSTAKQSSAGSFLPVPAILAEEFALSNFGMYETFGWHVPLEVNMAGIGVGDGKLYANVVDKLDDVETCSGSSESFSAGALSEVNVDQDNGPMFINVGKQMCAHPLCAPLKLVRSLDGELCALGDI